MYFKDKLICVDFYNEFRFFLEYISNRNKFDKY